MITVMITGEDEFRRDRAEYIVPADMAGDRIRGRNLFPVVLV
jgi:hypothetical protein